MQPAHSPLKLLHWHHRVRRLLTIGIDALDANADAIQAQGQELQGLVSIDQWESQAEPSQVPSESADSNNHHWIPIGASLILSECGQRIQRKETHKTTRD